jgi:Tol biopolymer transport system component
MRAPIALALGLLVLYGCGDDGGGIAPPSTGSLTITTATTGQPAAGGGYNYALDGGTAVPIGLNATATLTDIETGSHTVTLSGLPEGCTVEGANVITVTVSGGETASVAFAVTCVPPIGGIQVTTASTGPAPETYTLLLDGTAQGTVPASATQTVANIAAGDHAVGLADVPANCSVAETNPQPVTVVMGGTASVTFTVTCTPAPPVTGSLEIQASTTGQEPDGYQVTVDGGAAQAIGANASITVLNLAAGSHTVLLADVESTCTVGGENPRAIEVPAGGTVSVIFAVTCNGVPAPSRIAFTSVRIGNGAIMVVNPDGSGLTRLSPSGGGDFFPVWSPDGTRMLFSILSGDLWVMNADGTGRAELARGFISQYRWSPDGSRIAFLRERSTSQDTFEDLWLMQADGSKEKRLVTAATYPSWSPDGQRIAYASSDLNDNGIHVINVNGTGDTRITPADVDGFETAWAPDGSVIAFGGLGDKDILLINPDGSGLINLTNGRADDDGPVWSPDSRQILFTTGPLDNAFESEIAVMNRDGSGRTALTTHVGFDLSPDWSPDGRKIVYTQSDPADAEVLVMNADGSERLNVSNNRAADDGFADWGGGGSFASVHSSSLAQSLRDRLLFKRF